MDVSKVYQYAVKSVPMMPRALIGPGAAELAGAEAAGMGPKHVLFVTSGLRGTGTIDEMKSIFEKAGVAVSIYDKVESNPKDYNCTDSSRMYIDDECDGFISIGGGSSHDATKEHASLPRMTVATSTSLKAGTSRTARIGLHTSPSTRLWVPALK